MDPVIEYLKDWTKHYFTNKDVIQKSILEIIPNDQGLLIKKQDKEVLIIIKPDLQDLEALLADKDKTGHYTLILLNNKHNFDKVNEAWNNIKMFPFLTIYFVNPFSETEHKWIIQPHVHEKVSDRTTFKTGLKTMFDTVPEISVSDLQRKIA